MSDTEKVLTYEEAEELCRKAFDGGARYGAESTRYGVNAVAYDWEHWLKKNEHLFMPTPTVEDVLREFAHVGIRIGSKDGIKAGEFDFFPDEDAIAEYAKKLQLREGE